MPCRYYTEEEERKIILDELHLATRVACELANSIEKFHNIVSHHGYSDETCKWWTKHKDFDIKRKQEEEEKRRIEHEKSEALAKLTVKERELLGL